MTPEMSRSITVAGVPTEGRVINIEANAAERAALATRLGLPGIQSLNCRFLIRPLAEGGLGAEGKLTALIRQVCVVTGDEFESAVSDAFDLRFVPLQCLSSEIELDGPDCIAITGLTVDLGEAAAEQLALAMDAYPRRPGLAGDSSNELGTHVSPFAALAKPP